MGKYQINEVACVTLVPKNPIHFHSYFICRYRATLRRVSGSKTEDTFVFVRVSSLDGGVKLVYSSNHWTDVFVRRPVSELGRQRQRLEMSPVKLLVVVESLSFSSATEVRTLQSFS